MSDENNNENENAPDGAGKPDAGEDMSREAFRKVVAQREALKQELEQLRAKVPAKQEPALDGKKPDASGEPEWVQKINQRFDAFEQKLEGNQQQQLERTRTGALGKILEQVPEANRADAQIYLQGLEASKAIDLQSPTAVADAIARLNKTSVMLDASRGSPRRAPQIGADGKVDLTVFATMDDVPQDLRSLVYANPKEFDRLMGAATGNEGAVHNI